MQKLGGGVGDSSFIAFGMGPYFGPHIPPGYILWVTPYTSNLMMYTYIEY
jgi:hypothetical protein